ncbi:MAG: AhpC/TSA family protein [Prevotella sp.]|nr:AhpC/TSA family protein [Prevotella sp.]
MKAFRTSILFSVLTILAACQSNTYKISGTAEGLAEGDTLLLTTDLENGTPSDTVVVHDGKFTLEGETDSVRLAMLYSALRNEVNIPFFLEPGDISIALSETPGNSRVGGTKTNNEWQRLNDSVMVIGKEINAIAEHVYGKTGNEEEQQKGMKRIDELNSRFAGIVVSTVERNIDNEFGYFLLTYYPEELISNEQRSRFIGMLPKEMRNRPAIREMEAMLKSAAATAEGAVISDFSQTAPDGSEQHIMELIGQNEVTIIDFWASWCAPCRQEMPFMIELYNHYKDRGLGIVGISLDSEQEAWVQAIAKLGIPWPQMSDLQGWDNAAARQFNVTSIPHTIVVDRHGKILRRGLRGEELAQYIAEQIK